MKISDYIMYFLALLIKIHFSYVSSKLYKRKPKISGTKHSIVLRTLPSKLLNKNRILTYLIKKGFLRRIFESVGLGTCVCICFNFATLIIKCWGALLVGSTTRISSGDL